MIPMFVIDFIFQDWVVVTAALAMAGIGVGVLAMDDFKIAKISFLLSAAWAAGGVTMWGVKTIQPPQVKLPIIAILFVVIGFFTVGSWRYVNRKREARTVVIGNLKKRTNDLADEILLDLYMNGWQQSITIDKKHQWKLKYIKQLPSDSDEIRKWQEDRSEHFKFTFYDDVVARRDEFAQFHFRNESIDAFIKQYNDQQKDYVSVCQILDIAEQLKIMAAGIK